MFIALSTADSPHMRRFLTFAARLTGLLALRRAALAYDCDALIVRMPHSVAMANASE
jgi:hypothetical protein